MPDLCLDPMASSGGEARLQGAKAAGIPVIDMATAAILSGRGQPFLRLAAVECYRLRLEDIDRTEKEGIHPR